MRHRLAIGLLAAVVPLGFATYSYAKMAMDFEQGPPSFTLIGRPLGGATPAKPGPAHLAGSRIAAAGAGAIVIDADSGAMIRTDKAGAKVAELPIGKNAGLLAFDATANIAYVADRMGDRIVAVRAGDDGKLEQLRAWTTPVEPYGVALSPDRKTLLVTTVADRTLVAYDPDKGTERWRTPLAREPRNVAISPDGTRALVAYIATGTVDEVDLLETHRPEHVALATNSIGRSCRRCKTEGESYARAAFTVAFMGDHQAVVPFQRETPVQQSDGSERTSSYGGGFEAPIAHELAFIGVGDSNATQVIAQIGQHQPRAIAWDGAHDALYVAGLGTDSILQIQKASTVGITGGLETTLGDGKTKCGPDGVAIAPDGNVLVWCSFSRSVERVDFMDASTGALATVTKLAPGPSLVASSLGAKEHAGMELFASASPQVSARGGLACASCHPEVRDDGLSWRIDKHELQTPLLAGRVVGTHPYKWDGGDPTLRDSLTSTMKRLGGLGLSKGETDQLAAYLESVPAVRTPTRDPAAVARGKDLFDAPQLGCRSCHDGKNYTDQERHKFSGTLAESDTPSLIGLAASAPYFHDGSAATLEALLRDRGAVHGMAETNKLSDSQVSDLTAFLETL
jgi:sugar lactone lactonase YvrE